jgi:hypothetical protein
MAGDIIGKVELHTREIVRIRPVVDRRWGASQIERACGTNE